MHTIPEPPRPARSARALGAAVTALTISVAGLATGPAAWATQAHSASAGRATSTSGHSMSPKATEPTVSGQLDAVTKVSAQDVWAVGFNNTSVTTPLAEQYNGTSWRTVPTPSPAGAAGTLLRGATSTKTSVWAVGDWFSANGPRYTLAEKYTGTSWKIVSTPSPAGAAGAILYAVSAVSATNVWAVGQYWTSGGACGSDCPLVEHWNGHKWKVVSSPRPSGAADAELYGVSAVSGKDVWAAGLYYTSSGTCAIYCTLTEQYNGTNWHVVTSPNVTPNGTLAAVTGVSASDVWAVGQESVANTTGTLAEQWNGTDWQAVSASNPSDDDGFQGVTAVSASDVWAVGYNDSSTCPVDDCTLAERWNRTDWHVVTTPNDSAASAGGDQLNGVAAVSAKDVWAVGWADTATGSETLIEHWNGRKWTNVED